MVELKSTRHTCRASQAGEHLNDNSTNFHSFNFSWSYFCQGAAANLSPGARLIYLFRWLMFFEMASLNSTTLLLLLFFRHPTFCSWKWVCKRWGAWAKESERSKQGRAYALGASVSCKDAWGARFPYGDACTFDTSSHWSSWSVTILEGHVIQLLFTSRPFIFTNATSTSKRTRIWHALTWQHLSDTRGADYTLSCVDRPRGSLDDPGKTGQARARCRQSGHAVKQRGHTRPRCGQYRAVQAGPVRLE